MKEIIQKELESLMKIVLNWKEDYLSSAEGVKEFLVKEFEQEIETYVSPYVRRLYEMKYLTENEAKEFMELIYEQVNDLYNMLVKEDK
jgi:archaellum biogenesis protein FlaJ (TadC family)